MDDHSTASPARDEPFKVIVIGEPGVGKSSLLQRLQFRRFEANPMVSLGLEFFWPQYQCGRSESQGQSG